MAGHCGIVLTATRYREQVRGFAADLLQRLGGRSFAIVVMMAQRASHRVTLRRASLLLAVAGCGRIGFDATTDAVHGDAIEA